LTVAVAGAPTPTLQWFKNNVTVANQTSTTLTISPAAATDTGVYTVVATNSVGSATSNAATLTVTSGNPVFAPSITTQPVSIAGVAGGNAVFTVVATGSPSYQWRKNGVAVTGATIATLTLNNLAVTDAGTYDVVLTNTFGSVTSSPASLYISGPLTSRLSNVAVRTTLAANQILIVGITMQGGAKNVLIRAVGPSLAALGVPGTMADPKLAVFNGQSQIAVNDNWAGDSNVATAISSVGAFPLVSAGSLDAALVTSISGGRTVQVSGPNAGNLIVEAYDAGTGNSPRLTNLSALNFVGTGNDILIAGFTVAGTGSKNLLIRAAGPSLGALGVSNVLADPKPQVFNSSAAKIAENDTYDPALSGVFANLGAFAFTPGAKDAALIVNLPPGGYTVQVSGADGGTGSAIVEVYELP
jgi:hypothetical protein